MTRSPVIIAVLERDNAVTAWRDLMGATDPAKAAAGTIRKQFGSNVGENATHGSDSLDNAQRGDRVLLSRRGGFAVGLTAPSSRGDVGPVEVARSK